MMDANDWQSRTKLLLGQDAAERLFQAHVLVVGLGGVGGIAAEMIARAGVREMTIVDGDTFDITNRNRQIGALVSTSGRSKAAVMAERLRDINPDLILHEAEVYLEQEKIATLLDAAPYTCVLDAIDSITPKVRLLQECVARSLPVVSCMGSGARLDPEQIRCVDISKTTHCPLAKVVRSMLRKAGIEKGIHAVFSPEDPVPGSVVESADAGPYKRSITGTISYMPNLFGCHCAAAVIRLISGR